MTQFYKVPGFTLANANLSTKILVTLFMVTVLLGLGVALLQYYERAGGFGQDDAKNWVKGNEGDFEATRIMAEKSFAELVSITHEHAFSVPILAFVVLHLVGLTSISERKKIAFYVAGFLSVIVTFAAPWLVYYQGTGWTFLLVLSGSAMTLVMALACLLCLFEMWCAAPIRKARKKPEPPPPNPMFPKLREKEDGED